MKLFPVLRPLAPALLLALISACSTTGTGTTGAVVVDGKPDRGEEKVVVPEPPPPVPAVGDTPYADLVARAGRAREAGDFEQALALLERAQRIDPDSADIYLALAQTHRARGDLAQARATAERGLLYCSARSQCDALRAYTR